jgi:hypothetical protein
MLLTPNPIRPTLEPLLDEARELRAEYIWPSWRRRESGDFK